MITLTDLSKSYNKETFAVDHINLEIKDGEIFGFLGPNGAGKTTVLKILTGILEPTSGTVNINGFDMAKNPLEAKFQFGFVSDDPNVFLRLKGAEYLKFMADIYLVPGETRKERIDFLAKEFSMEKALGDKIQSYSHGMRQKIVLMGALLHNPNVWILDEPMTGLDPQSSFVLKNMMRRHADAGKTVIFSTHVLEVAEKICDRVAIIDKGNILFCGTIAELKAQQGEGSLESIFLQLVGTEEQILSEYSSMEGL